MTMKKRTKQALLWGVGIVLLIPAAIAGVYLTALTLSDYQPEDVEELDVLDNPGARVPAGDDLKIVTYNIGFGAYAPDFDFFMDGGTMSRAKSRESVAACIDGSIQAMNGAAPDFALIQEVDVGSTRSYQTDQYRMIRDGLGDAYGTAFAVNYKVPYIAYPFYSMHGRVLAGIVTASRFQSDACIRLSLPIDESWLARLFGLDRCVILSRLPVQNGKELVLLNTHLSAYDKGGQIRQQQLGFIERVLREEYEAGNYVILGGDFNHVFPNTDIDRFLKKEPRPDWFTYLPESFQPAHYTFQADPNTPTTRSDAQAYDPEYTFTAVIDGFLVSDNIEVTAVQTLDLGFAYSDHQPVTMTFRLS